MFYLDVPLAETLRHELRPLRQEVAPELLVEWYRERDVLGLPGEVVLSGIDDEDDCLQALLDAVGPVAETRHTATSL